MKKSFDWIAFLFGCLIVIILLVAFHFFQKATAALKKLKEEKEKELQRLFTELEKKGLQQFNLDRFSKTTYVCLKVSVMLLFVSLNCYIVTHSGLNIFEALLTSSAIIGLLHLMISALVFNRVVSLDELLSITSKKITSIVYEWRNFDPEEIEIIKSEIDSVKSEIAEIDEKLKNRGVLISN